jgi:PKD repeat protein
VSCQATPRSGKAPLPVAFAAFPTGATGSYEFLWSFGDGSTSTNPNPSHTYAVAGTFDAFVRVTSGGQAATCSREIVVTPATEPGPGPTPTPGPTVVTVTITNAGVSPATVQISRGSSVRFVNQSSSSHQMNSDPHPTHGNCPPLNQTPFLNPGQSGQTGAFITVGTCGYHDHLNPTNGGLQGTVQVVP